MSSSAIFAASALLPKIICLSQALAFTNGDIAKLTAKHHNAAWRLAMPISFKNYLKRARVSDTPAGDFIADARLDKMLPAARTWDELEVYLLSQWGSDPIGAAHSAWRNYEAFQRRAQRTNG
jgi:hypothetical protein